MQLRQSMNKLMHHLSAEEEEAVVETVVQEITMDLEEAVVAVMAGREMVGSDQEVCHIPKKLSLTC